MSVANFCRYLRQRPVNRLVAKAWRILRESGVTGLRWRLQLLDQQNRGYSRWLQKEAANETAERSMLAAELAALSDAPLISVVMPVFDTPERWLRKAIDSVCAQLYPHWQLCIADDASTASYIRPLLEAAAAADSRIRVVFRNERGHICGATRSALALTTGKFITFLDHDDELSPLALGRIAMEIGHHPETDLLYTDEDLIGTDGRRYDPYFKPDWNPELLRAQNYLCHLSVYRAKLLQGLDPFRSELQGSQDWDLALRATEQAQHIRHLPYILYHWRSIPGSTAHSDTAKKYALEAGCRAVQNHLERCDESAEAELLGFGHLRVRHKMPQAQPRVSLIVTTTSAPDIAPQLANLLAQTTYSTIEVLLATVSEDKITPLEGVQVIHADGDETPSQLLNRAASAASGDILCFVDATSKVIDPDWLETLVSLANLPRNGAVGGRILRADGTVWHAGYLLDPKLVILHPYRGAPASFAGQRNRALLQQNISAVSIACLAVKKAIFENLHGFDASSGCFFDVDFCLRLLEVGLRNIWTPHASLILQAHSYGYPDECDNLANSDALRYMQARWHKQLSHDPSGNPNLTIESGIPTPRTVST